MNPNTKFEEVRYSFSFPSTKVVLAADSQRHGIVALQTGKSPLNLIREPYYGLNVYRLMSSGQLMAIARSEPFQVTEATEQRMVLDWQSTSAHPVKLNAAYELVDETTIDFTLSAVALQPLEGYEISICTYFDFSMEPYTVIADKQPGHSEGALQLFKVEDHPYVKGYYVCFPRDARTAHMRTDGRWRDNNTGNMIAHHVIGPYYGKPIAIMANKEHYIVQMTDSTHCNGIDTTYSSDDKKDHIMLHNALYFNCFGDHFQKGERRATRIRQVLCQGEIDLSFVLRLYEEFLTG